MPSELSALLRQTIDRELPILSSFPQGQVSVKPAGGESWSPKEELGHLIDSAVNNHVRFVRAASEPELHGSGYAQNEWVRLHQYQDQSWDALVDFWYCYNCFLLPLINAIPETKLDTKCFIGREPEATLDFLVRDYVLHMQHHIDHLLGRPEVTAYPAVKSVTA